MLLNWIKEIKYFLKDVYSFIRNIFYFRKSLWNHRPYDYAGMLMFMRDSIIDISSFIDEKGNEVEESKSKKVYKMLRASQLINNCIEDNYLEQAEKVLGEWKNSPIEFEEIGNELYELKRNLSPEDEEHNTKLIKLSNEIMESEWKELFDILEGQDFSKFDKNIPFEEQFDGSGIKGWWD